MTQTHKVDTCSSACGAFNLEGVNLGTKTMREIMDAATLGHGWAKNVIAADRATISNYYALNPANSRQNLYGALSLGINVNHNFNSSDKTVTAKLGEWMKNLNTQFKGIASYTPDSLKQRAVDLGAAAECIGKNTATLAAAGELTVQDASFLNLIVDGMKSYSQAAHALHKAVCGGPDVKSVALNIPAQKH